MQAEIEKVQKRREEREAEKQRMEEELVRLSCSRLHGSTNSVAAAKSKASSNHSIQYAG